jgi:hypothetical protein
MANANTFELITIWWNLIERGEQKVVEYIELDTLENRA